MSRHRALRPQLGFEPLEDRSLLAGNVVAVLTEGTLTILGDEQANGVTIVYDVASKTHQVLGADCGGSATSVNGEPDSGPHGLGNFSGVKHIQIRLGVGNDRLDFGAADQVYTAIAKKLTIEMGSGNDEVVLGRAGNDPSVGTGVLHRLYVNQGIYVDLGAGDDQLEIANLKTNKSLIIFAGDGNDEITFATEFTPTGATAPKLFPVLIRGNMHVQSGQGDDELTILHALIGQHLKVHDPSGAALVNIADVGVEKKIEIITGHQNDQVLLDYIAADDIKVETNGGNDYVKIDHTRLKRLNVRTGGGSDDLTLRNSRTTQVTYLDGGEGDADYSSRNNILRGLVRRNLS